MKILMFALNSIKDTLKRVLPCIAEHLPIAANLLGVG